MGFKLNIPLGASTDGSNHGSQKVFPVVIHYFHEDQGIQSKLIQLNCMPNERSKLIVDCVIKALKDQDFHMKCISFSGDNANTNFGKINRSGSKKCLPNLEVWMKEN